MKRLIVVAGLSLLANGCADIWNAGDLHEWVHKQAVNTGCEPDSIVLDDWYTPENGHNIWHGTCDDKKSGEQTQLRIGVDKVWKPSST